jgi:hypothetical protein
LYIHPGSYTSPTIPNNTPLTIVGVQDPKGELVSFTGNLIQPTNTNSRAIRLANLKVNSVTLYNSADIDGCVITTLIDQAQTSFVGTTTVNLTNSTVGYYDGGTSARDGLSATNTTFTTCSINDGTYNLTNCLINRFTTPFTPSATVNAVNTTIYSNQQLTLQTNLNLSSCKILDFTGSAQSLIIDTNYGLRYADTIINAASSSADQFYGTSYGIINAKEVSGSLFGTSSWAVTASFAMNAKAGGSVTVSGSAPIAAGIESGSLWWNTNDGNLYIQATTPTGSTWVPATTTIATPVTASYATTAADLILARTASYLNDTAASAAGVPLYGVYRSASFILVRTV